MNSMGAPRIIILGFCLVFCCRFSSSSTTNILREGSSLVVDTKDHALTSPNGTFSAGFYPVGDNAYCFAIWYGGPSCNTCAVVWMANRDQPVNGISSTLSLLNGSLVLKDAGNIDVWQIQTDDSATSLQLDDIGNLFLVKSSKIVLWQSFDSPTDTLLPLQPLVKKTVLISSRSQTNFSSGFFKLLFDTDNVLQLMFDGPEPEGASPYWPAPWLLTWEAGRSTYNSSRIAVLDSLGYFSATDSLTFISADYGLKAQRRLKIDYDGNLRLYSRVEGQEDWIVSWEAFSDPCTIHGSCGPNSVCSYVPASGRKCSCIPGYRMKNGMDWSLGCEPEFDLPSNQSEVGFLKLSHTDFYGYDYNFNTNWTLEICMNFCLNLSDDCKGIVFASHKAHMSSAGIYCYPKTLLLNGHTQVNFDSSFYLKLPKAIINNYSNDVMHYSLECPIQLVELLERYYPVDDGNDKTYLFLIYGAAVIGGIELFCVLFVWYLLTRARDNSGDVHKYMLAGSSFRKFTYSELKKATNGFMEEIGRGAGGIVYKGRLSDHRVAAIKRLIDANQGEAEFLAEVSTIGKLNHMNLIDMWGYCAEGNHRLLVYEYMEHGSLARNLSSKALDWKRRFEIAVGTARGLGYLHEECLEWVLHCDIKSQNILLDSDYHPKVVDFGMSRLLTRDDLKNPGFSRMRGTRGYMAPEWVLNCPITAKVDVYSFGIVLLEMVTGRSPGIPDTEDGSGNRPKRTLVTWVREHMKGSLESGGWMGEIIDPSLDGKYDPVEMLILVGVALQCVEEEKDARPTMSQVLRMLNAPVENQLDSSDHS